MDYFGCDYFILDFKMYCPGKIFGIFYNIMPERKVQHETECLGETFCHYGSSKSMLDRIRSILANDELKSQMADSLPPSNMEGYGYDEWEFARHKVFIHFNVNQYYRPQCSRTLLPYLEWRFCKLYLRTHG